jgi:hypothetical protein
MKRAVFVFQRERVAGVLFDRSGTPPRVFSPENSMT